MNCLCCGKPLKNNPESGWHEECIRKFFGSAEIPLINLDDDSLKTLVNESTEKGCTVPGVQKKLSLRMISNSKRARMTLTNYLPGFILKPQVKEYPAMPESEQLVMLMADRTGIQTVPHGLILIGQKYGYITKRVDRIFKSKDVVKLAMEDFCQLDLRLTEDKYKGSYERCCKIIDRYSSFPGMDKAELFLRLLFCFITGNSDMHLKNFSLIEKRENSGEYILSRAYDLLPVNLLMPQDLDEFALTLNGKNRNIRKKDFLVFAENVGIGKAAANKMIEKVVNLKDAYIDLCKESLLPDIMKNQMIELMTDRFKVLEE